MPNTNSDNHTDPRLADSRADILQCVLMGKAEGNRAALEQWLNSRGSFPMPILAWLCDLRADCQCTTGIITALADQSTIVTTPENLIGQGVVITQYFVNLGEVAHAARRRGCLIASNNSCARRDCRPSRDTISTLVSVCGNVWID